MDGTPRTWVYRLPLMVLAVLAAGFLALGVAEARADANHHPAGQERLRTGMERAAAREL